MREFLHGDRWIMLGRPLRSHCDIAVPLRIASKYEATLPQIVAMAEAGSTAVANCLGQPAVFPKQPHKLVVTRCIDRQACDHHTFPGKVG